MKLIMDVLQDRLNLVKKNAEEFKGSNIRLYDYYSGKAEAYQDAIECLKYESQHKED